MKKLFTILAVAAFVFAACGQKNVEAPVVDEVVIEEVVAEEAVADETTVEATETAEVTETPAQ